MTKTDVKKIRKKFKLSKRELGIILGYSAKVYSAPTSRVWELERGKRGISPKIERKLMEISTWDFDRMRKELTKHDLDNGKKT